MAPRKRGREQRRGREESLECDMMEWSGNSWRERERREGGSGTMGQ